MTIETKFAIGDRVWLLQNNKATEMEIRSIFASKSTVPVPAIHITYCGEGKDENPITARECDCFFSKQALVDYITSE